MKVAIVGGSPSTQFKAPFNDTEWEIWVHGNQMDRHLKHRVTRIFEIHDDLSEHDDKYPAWLVDFGMPLVAGRAFPIKGDNVETFPFKRAEKLLDGEHLTSTPAYMMAYALLKGATHISVYGVDMAVDDHEYFYQRPTMYAWIGYARGRGVKVDIPDESPLFKDAYVEGRGSGGKPDLGLAPFTQKNLIDMAALHAEKKGELQAQISRLEALIHTHDGARQAYERLAKVARAVESGQVIHSLSDSAVIK